MLELAVVGQLLDVLAQLKKINITHFSPQCSVRVHQLNNHPDIFDGHAYDCYELIMLVGGKGNRCIGDVISISVNKELILIPPFVSHVWDTNSTAEYAIVVLFSSDFMDSNIPEQAELMTWLSTLRQGVSLSLADPQHDQIYIEPLTKIKKSLPFERVLILLSVIHQFFCDCQLDADDRIVQPQAKLAHLTEFLQGEENKSLTSCAEALNMSDSTLKRWLKNDFDTTFTELYCQLRLKEAQKLLVRTGIPVNVVAEQSGFNSVRAFNEAFKKHLQVTPVVYRSQYKWRTVRR